MGLLILADFLIQDADSPPRSRWGARVDNGLITTTGSHEDLRRRFPDDAVWEAPGQILAPGFVNTHTHMYGLLSHGIPLQEAPSGFWPFLKDFWWPRIEDRLDQGMIRAATAAACREMALSGTTTFYDCLEAPFALPGVLAVEAAVVQQIGLRAILSFEATERVSQGNGQLGLRENTDFIDHCHEFGPLLSGLMCIHTTFTCSASFIQEAHRLALERGVLLHMHLSESRFEPDYCLQHFGVRPVLYYDRIGVLGPHVLASQCVQVDEAEIALLAERGAKVAHMPLSNCEVGGGFAPAPEMLDAGIPVGLGSDGYINDMFEVMRGAFLLHKARREDPRVMPAARVWAMATSLGAQTLGLTTVGRIAPGYAADLILIDARLPTPTTPDNLLEQVLLHKGHHDVRMTMVAGKVIAKDGQLVNLDDEAVIAGARQAAQRLWGE